MIAVTREGPLTIITIDRQEVRNSLDVAAQHELSRVFDDFASDDDQWLAIVTGAGEKAFCAGADLKEQATGQTLNFPALGFGGLTSRFDLAKPVIAAVNGAAFGGGFEFALACDIIVAAETAAFGLPEPRFGMAAMAGGFQRLPLSIGVHRAMGILLTGRSVSAQEGYRLGFVNEVVPDALAAARKWSRDVLACGPLSVRATKECVLRSMAMGVESALAAQWDWPGMQKMLASTDRYEGPRSFAEKREPRWSGR